MTNDMAPQGILNVFTIGLVRGCLSQQDVRNGRGDPSYCHVLMDQYNVVRFFPLLWYYQFHYSIGASVKPMVM
jgi:hypothetical protein